MINVVQNGNIYQITFKYDPAVIELVKSVPGRQWVPAVKMWTIPRDKLGFLLNQFKGTRYESYLNIVSDEKLNQNSTLDTTSVIPNIDVSKIPFYVKEDSKPYNHQIDFMKYAVARQLNGNRSGFLLADGPGLGKTIEVANLALYNRKQYGFQHCLIICCVNGSKYNWKSDIELHTNGVEVPYILGTRKRRDGSLNENTGSKEKLQDIISMKKYGKSEESLPYFLIVNIEAIRYQVGKTYPIADTIATLVNNGVINMIAIDEIHKNASPTSKQGKQINRIKKMTGDNAMWIPMTGTPIVNKPTDVYLPLKLIDGHNYSTYWSWCQTFCLYGGYGGHEIMGYKNIPTLKNLVQSNMLRRVKEDVLDLPPKIYYTEYVENTPYQVSLYRRVLNGVISDREEILNSLNPLTALLRLRQVNGSPELIDETLKVDKDYIKSNAKLKRLLELLEDITSRGEKVVVYSNWVEPLRTLYRFVSIRYKTCCFTGTMSPADRENHKYVFQNNPEYKVLLGTIGAAGTSHTFTAATNVIFYDEPWTPSDKEQAEDRIYRIGTKSSVNIITLITKDTVDERVNDILYNKRNISKYIVDNKLDLRKNPGLFDLLIGRS